MEELGRIRSKLVDMLLDQDVINLLRFLWERNVLNEEEKKTVEGKMTSKDRACCLIDTVMEKGKRESSLMVDYLTERRPELCSALGLNPTSALIKLGRIRSKLVDKFLNYDVINLLRYLWEMNVLNDEEKKTVEGKTTSEDKAHCLIDTVMKKGERESSVMVDYLTERPPALWPTLGLTPTSALIKLGSIRSKLVYMLSDHDVIKLLRCLWEMNVFNDKQKKTVEGKMTREDKARCLIYTVMGKGVTASSLMVDYLTEKHPELCLTLGLTPTSARIKLEIIRSKFVDMLSYSDFINLLHYLWEKNVLNDEEKKTVEGKTTREDKARCLIDTVMGKGATASRLTVDYLTKRHPELCSTLDPTRISAQIRFGGNQSFSSRQESPGLMSPSLPLEMHKGDSELEPLMTSGSSGQGSLSKSELSGPVDSESSLPFEKLGSTQELGRIRSKLVDMLLDQDVINLLRYLREMNVLNDEEKEIVEGWMTSEGKARCLIDTVMKKGARESSVMVDYLTERPPELWPTLGLTPTSALIKLGRIRSKLVYTLSDHDVINLLRYLREMNEFNDEEKKTVEGKTTREDKARCLIYAVLGKGERASSLMVDYLTARQPELCLTLGLTPTSARIKLERIRSKLVDVLSYNDFIYLLHNLRKLNVLNDEEKKTVEGKTTREDKARCLIDTVKEKGGKASSLMVDYLTEKHPELCSTLDPTKTAQIRFGGDPSFSSRQESPGLMSPSLPLEMHEGDSELGAAAHGSGAQVNNSQGAAGEDHAGQEPLMTSGSSGPGRLSRPELSGSVDSESSLPLEKLGSAQDKVYETRSPGQDLSAEQLRDVAQTLGRRWEKAALHLGLTNEDLDDIREEEMAEFMQRRKMLRLWKSRRPGKATAQDLLRGLEGLKVLPAKTRLLLEGFGGNPSFSSGQESHPGPMSPSKSLPKIPSHKPLMTSGSSGQWSLSKSELSGPVDSESSLPFSMPGSTLAGEKTKRKSCNRPPGKAKAKDPLRCVKGLEDLPVKTRQFLIGLLKNHSKPVKKKPSCSSGQGSRPGELSSSLPLKTPANDGMLGFGGNLSFNSGQKDHPGPTFPSISLPKIPSHTGEKTKRKSCNRSPGKAKAKDPLRGMKGLEDLPVEIQQLLKGLVKNLSKPVKKKPSCSKGQGSLPGERSSSLPLKMPASDGMLAGVKTERKSCNRSPGKANAKDPLSSMKGLEDIPVETHQLLKAGEKTKRKSCNRSPGKAKAKDPLRGMKGLEDIPVETQQLLKGLVQNLSKPVKKKPSCSSGQGSRPGERSSSLPLKMPASDGMLGNISEKTVAKPRKPKRVELRMVRCEFVKTVKISVIRGLLDDLLEQKVFSTEDKVSVMENERSRKDRARCLIDMVIGKGEKASRIMIASMKKKYNDLCSTLGLISSPAGVGHVDDQTLVKQRKQNKGNGGRKRNGSKSEEVAHKKPCTVDVSDSITETHSTGQTLTDKELMNVADTLGQEWEPAAIHLELTTKDLDDIKAEHRPVAMQKLMMLVRWKGRRPPGKATAQDLLNCLTDLKHLPVETHQLLTELMKCHSELDGSVQRKQ